MTADELKEVLATSSEALKANRDIITPPVLDEFRKFVAALRVHPASKQVIDYMNQEPYFRTGSNEDFDLDRLLNGLDHAIKTEEKLIGNEGLTIIRMCDTLQDRHMLLAMIARFL